MLLLKRYDSSAESCWLLASTLVALHTHGHSPALLVMSAVMLQNGTQESRQIIICMVYTSAHTRPFSFLNYHALLRWRCHHLLGHGVLSYSAAHLMLRTERMIGTVVDKLCTSRQPSRTVSSTYSVLLWQTDAMPGMAIQSIADSKITCAVPAGRMQCHCRDIWR